MDELNTCKEWRCSNPPNARAPSPVRGLSGLFDRKGLHMIALGCLQD